MKPGDKMKIAKRTFLHKGIFVHTHSLVEILSVEGDLVTVIYLDREGNPHEIGLVRQDLVPC